MRSRLTRWHLKAKEAKEPDREEPGDWEPPLDIESAWAAWTLLTSTGWKHLLAEGGLLDQPEQLFQDVATIEWLSGLIEPMIGDRGMDDVE